MAYKLSSLKSTNDFNYDNEIKAILKLLKDTWDIEASPKGYAEYMKSYKDHDGMEEVQNNEEKLLKKFKGHSDGTISSDCLVIRLTKEYVGYDDHNQKRKPFEVLIQTILTHGIVLGQQLADLDKKSEPYELIEAINHTYEMSDHSDKELGKIYDKEFKALMNLKDSRTLQEIRDAFNLERELLERSRFLPILQSYIKKHDSFIAYQSSKDKDLNQIYGYIHTQTGSEKKFNEFLEYMISQGINVEPDGQHAFIITKTLS